MRNSKIKKNTIEALSDFHFNTRSDTIFDLNKVYDRVKKLDLCERHHTEYGDEISKSCKKYADMRGTEIFNSADSVFAIDGITDYFYSIFDIIEEEKELNRYQCQTFVPCDMVVYFDDIFMHIQYNKKKNKYICDTVRKGFLHFHIVFDSDNYYQVEFMPRTDDRFCYNIFFSNEKEYIRSTGIKMKKLIEIINTLILFMITIKATNVSGFKVLNKYSNKRKIKPINIDRKTFIYENEVTIPLVDINNAENENDDEDESKPIKIKRKRSYKDRTKEIPLHQVRGHFKIYNEDHPFRGKKGKVGALWVPSFYRGDQKYGVIRNHYKID